MVTLEICVDNYQSIINAQKAGADRLELCNALGVEGLTPSPSLVNFAKDNFIGSLQAMIRHRAGDFYYDDTDQKIMLNDSKLMLELGVDGIVIGALTKDNKVDSEFLKPFIELAKKAGKELTFHRAIDLADDVNQATQEIIGLGFDRILTSGGAKNVTTGIDSIKAIQQNFNDEIAIMPGGGINSDNVLNILNITKVNNIHCSASKKIQRCNDFKAFPAESLEVKISQVDEMLAIKKSFYGL
jgi:copper homeostasis protein